MIRAIHNNFSRRIPVNSVVHFVLNGGKKPFGGCGGCVIIQRSGVNIRNLLIKLAFRKPNLTNLFKLAFKELIGQVATMFKALHIHRPTLYGVVLDNLIGPLSKLNGTFIFYLEADSDDGL